MSHYDLRDISEKLSGSKDSTSVISSFLGYLQTMRRDWKASIAFYECSTDRLVSIYSLEGNRLLTADVPSAPAALVAVDRVLPLPRPGETMLTRARALMAGGHFHEALAALEAVRPTDPQKAEADRLRGDIQRQLLALTSIPSGGVPGTGNRPGVP